MIPQRNCAYCHELFNPYSGRQNACPKQTCQKQRRQETNRRYYQANRYERDHRWKEKKAWSEAHGQRYMRTYRKKNLDYVKRNRAQQRERNRRRRKKIVKSDVWKRLYSGKLMRISVLEQDCKVRLIRLLPE
jgi:hypothetical protein